MEVPCVGIQSAPKSHSFLSENTHASLWAVGQGDPWETVELSIGPEDVMQAEWGGRVSSVLPSQGPCEWSYQPYSKSTH